MTEHAFVGRGHVDLETSQDEQLPSKGWVNVVREQETLEAQCKATTEHRELIRRVHTEPQGQRHPGGMPEQPREGRSTLLVACGRAMRDVRAGREAQRSMERDREPGEG